MKRLKNYVPLTLLACLPSLGSLAQNKNMDKTILVTHPYLEDLVNEVTCRSKEITVTSLLPSGIDPHTFKLLPSHREKIAQAKTVFWIGKGMEGWMTKVKPSSQQKIISVAQDLPLEEFEEEEEHHHGHHHHDDEMDYHIWHSPRLTGLAAEKVASEIKKVMPEKSKEIEMCLSQFQKSIADTKLELTKLSQNVPADKKNFAMHHASLHYFAKEFDFKIMPLLGLSTHAKLSPQKLKKVIDGLKKDKVAAVFLESSVNNQPLVKLAEQNGIKVGGNLHGDTFPSANDKSSTLRMWKENMTEIVKVLSK